MLADRLLIKFFFSLLSLTNGSMLYAQQAEAIYDGPYVFYEGDYIKVRSIINSRLVSDSFPLTNKGNIKVKVRSAEWPSWDFDVPIRLTIDTLSSITATPGPLFVLSDVEGEFGSLRQLLINNKVIDKQHNWQFGNG